MATHAAINAQTDVVADSNTHILYWLGGFTALLMLLLILADTSVSMMAPAEDSSPGELATLEWFDLFDDDPLRGLRDLGIINIFNSILGIPTYLAVYILHKKEQSQIALLGLVIFLFGSAIYIANNTVLPMLVLSDKYAVATSEVERASLLAAGEAMLARGADFTPGSIVGFVLPSIGTILIAYTVAVGQTFSRLTGYIGMIGLSCLLIFTVWTTFFPESFETAMLIAMPGGLLAMAWNAALARRLFQLARNRSEV